MQVSLLIIDDELKMCKALKHVLAREGYDVDITDDPREGLQVFSEKQYSIVLCDLKMPGLSGLDVLEHLRKAEPNISVIMMTAYASAETAVEAMKKGAYDYLIKPFSMDELKILVKRCCETQNLQAENQRLREQLDERFSMDNIVAASKQMQTVLKRARKVADSQATVLITGESGTGKELLASVIHQQSPRRDRPLVTVNCGALPENLLESELFGHEKGAFTGAEENREGRFQIADKGTLFLDEIGEISPAMQVKLLRVLQAGEMQRVGESQTRTVDVRVVAATNRNLEEMVADGSFRTDLYYRLNVVPIFVPPLSERRADIPPLIEHFLENLEPSGKKHFSRDALEVLQAYDWPGNVRELENAVEHAVVLSEGTKMEIDSLPLSLRSFVGQEPAALNVAGLEKMTLEEAEKRMIKAAMERTSDNMTRAARQLGITRRALGYRLHKYGMYENSEDDDQDDYSGASLIEQNAETENAS
ncbi:MAG: sigma-54-dependent transcriptional regulator [Candidatus Sumerlaeota bacterium]